MARKTKLKIAIGRLEEERQKSDDRFEYQRVMLFLLPLLMIAVLVVGVYFGYLSYKKTHTPPGTLQPTAVTTKLQRTDEENDYLLTIVSSASPVASDFVPELSDYNGIKVSSLMVNDLDRMITVAKESGVNISVTDGYVSFEEQKSDYEQAVKNHKKKNKCSTVKAEAAVKKTIPNAGESELQTGLIVKLAKTGEKDFSKTKEYDWLIKNSVDYGFVLRYPDKENTGGLVFSADLFRYVGVENAKLMRSYDMNLDEFVQYLGVQ